LGDSGGYRNVFGSACPSKRAETVLERANDLPAKLRAPQQSARPHCREKWAMRKPPLLRRSVVIAIARVQSRTERVADTAASARDE
jgi:hypothetical protein